MTKCGPVRGTNSASARLLHLLAEEAGGGLSPDARLLGEAALPPLRMRSAWIQTARSSRWPGGARGPAPAPAHARGWPSRVPWVPSVLVLAAVGLVFAATPVRSLAQSAGILRPFADPDRPSLLDDGDADSLRTALAQSLAWLDRQPQNRPLAFGPRRVTTAEYAGALRRLVMLLANDPPAEVIEDRVLEHFDVLVSVGRLDGAVLLTGYHEPVIHVSDRQRPEYPVPVLGLPANFTGGWSTRATSAGRRSRRAGSARRPGRSRGPGTPWTCSSWK